MRVLLVDDHQPTLTLLTDICQNAWKSLTLYRATSAEMAREILPRHPIDIVVADWCMPGMSGLDMLATMKQDFPLLPVILYSGLQLEAEDLQTALSAGAWDYFRKPFEATEVVARMQNVLYQAQRQRQVVQSNENKNSVFRVLSQHLLTETQRLRLSLNLLERHLQRPSEYVARLLSETLDHHDTHHELLQGLLQWSHLQFEAVKVQPQTFSLRTFIERLALTYADTKDKNFRVRIPKELTLSTDPLILQRVLHHLLTVLPGEVVIQSKTKDTETWLIVRSECEDTMVLEGFQESPANSVNQSLKHFLNIQSCRLLLETLGGHLFLDTTTRDQALRVVVSLPSESKA